MGIIKVESNAGKAPTFRVVKQDKSRFYGIGQLTMGAARAVMSIHPGLWSVFNTHTDEELQARILLDDRFNIQVVSKYLLMMGVNKNPLRSVVAYQIGPGQVKTIEPTTHPYALKVKAQGALAMKEVY